MVNISLFCLFRNSIDCLCFGCRSQCAGRKHLRLTSLEKPGSVNSRKKSRFAENRSDFVAFSVVRTDSLVENHAANGFFCNVVENRINILHVVRISFCKVLFGFNFNSIHVVKSFKLVNRMDGFSHLRSRVFSYCCVDFFKRLVKFDFHLRLTDFYNNLVDEFNNFLDLFMCEKNRIKHIHFRNFLRAGFYHHNRFLRSGNRHIDIGNFSLRKSRIDNKSSVHSADFYGSGRAVPRNIGNRDCDG